ncbi:MAG TPA: hypothetical protein VK906_06790 [Egicoccus sp.]|nr:hypothetical protein [Egicoccus sp.]HSK22863.1 hypothetical protein [Egicoccus sp.]
MPRQPDAEHARPDGVDDATVAAVGRIGEAFEWVVRARGTLYTFHQQMGRADLILGEGIRMLRDAGHDDLADDLSRTWLGRNAIEDRWTFEIVEDFDRTYHDVAAAGERRVREQLVAGRHHVHESEMKANRRADGPTAD